MNTSERHARRAGPERPRAVIFDWDNTLVDTWPTIHDALDHTFRAYGLKPWTLEETRARVRRSMRESFPPLFGDRWEEAGQVFYARFQARHLDTLTPLDGAAEMLEALQAAGCYLAVVSNKTGRLLRREADHLGWSGRFGRLVGAGDTARDKPAVDPVDLALDGTGIPRGDDVWFAGDTDVDLECARAAACRPVLVRPRAPAPGEFADHAPWLHVESPRALCKLILSM
ncbi:MAG: HAD family hydrolase [Rhodobacterales bacterium]|nr:HAD family hydrolase [Rhodobacterales bacterium]